MKYTTLTKIVCAVIALYVSIGIGTHLFSHNQEPYPFFSWFLFSQAPDKEEVDYTILIHAAGEKTFTPALTFETIDGLYNKEYPTTYYNQKIRQLARSIEADDSQSKINSLKNEIESHFLIKPVRYEVAKITYNPIERWNHGTIINGETLYVFETKK